MNALVIGAIALAGWCGTVPISELIRLLLRRFPPVPPIPPRFLFTTQLVGLAGGVAVGTAYNQAFPAESVATQVLVSSLGAFLGSYAITNAVVNLRLANRPVFQGDPTPQSNVR
ncbi:MAG: hypothetical protein OHK0037_38050 [Elainellaceae cyanobacterium]